MISTTCKKIQRVKGTAEFFEYKNVPPDKQRCKKNRQGDGDGDNYGDDDALEDFFNIDSSADFWNNVTVSKTIR
jgi:hypothetical protein